MKSGAEAVLSALLDSSSRMGGHLLVGSCLQRVTQAYPAHDEAQGSVCVFQDFVTHGAQAKSVLSSQPAQARGQPFPPLPPCPNLGVGGSCLVTTVPARGFL